MNKQKTQLVHWCVLAGGGGERLWPLSTPERPKAFVPFAFLKGNLLQATLNRLAPFLDRSNLSNVQEVEAEKITVVISNALYPLAKQAIQEMSTEGKGMHLLAEPMARGTLASVAWYLTSVSAESDPVIVFLPSDHFIPDEERYRERLRCLVDTAADTGEFVFLGVKPSSDSGPYGYHQIRVEKNAVPSSFNASDKIVQATAFVEKPSIEWIAKQKSAGTKLLWNMGVSAARLSTWKRHLQAALGDQWIQLLNDRHAENFGKLPVGTPEIVLFSHLKQYWVVDAEVERVDLGNFSSLENFSEKKNKNKVVGSSEVVSIDSQNNFLLEHFPSGFSFAATEECIPEMATEIKKGVCALLEVEDLVIVNTPTTLLVMKKNKMDSLKEIRKLGLAVYF